MSPSSRSSRTELSESVNGGQCNFSISQKALPAHSAVRNGKVDPVWADVLEMAQEMILRAKTIGELRQAQAVVLPLAHGLSLDETAKAIGRSVAWTCRLRNRFLAGETVGDGQRQRPGGRRRQNLSLERESEVLAPFLERARDGGILVVPQIKAELEDALGRGQLYIDGKLVGQTDIPLTMPLSLGLGGGIVCGADSGSPVWDKYKPPFKFRGTLYSTTVDVSGELIKDDEATLRMHLARQ